MCNHPRRSCQKIRFSYNGSIVKSKVWFTSLSDGEPVSCVARKAVKLADSAGLSDIVRKNGLIGILQHVGEAEDIGYIKPHVTRALVNRILELEGKPFFTGTSTLYRGRRSNACDHIMQAYDHGFTPSAINCPVVMCDGLRGADHRAVEVSKAKHCKTAYLGSGVFLMDGLIAVTHPTGHPNTGFAASIKNIAMGLANRGGKMAMHHGGHPVFLVDRCTGCGMCALWCPENAIVVKEKAELIAKKCIGCGQCLAVCPSEAINFTWSQSGLGFHERLMEYGAAVQSQLCNRIIYLNVIQHFQKGCDCFGTAQDAICPDVGIAASRDPVAVDIATADLLTKATGKDIVLEVAKCDYRKMFAYAEKLGLGHQDYELIIET